MSGAAREKLAWPPTKGDLERLYIVEKLSAAKIAKAYGLKYATPKVAESKVLHLLKMNGIPRRARTEHIRMPSDPLVAQWVERYEKGESLSQIAGEEFSPVTVWNHLLKRGVRLRDKVEAQIVAVTKHVKRPFSGDAFEKAYLVGLRLGDLDVAAHGRAVRVRVSTTHPAMIELFIDLFSKYGFVHKYPKASRLTGFEWQLECDLDQSFGFLLNPQAEYPGIVESAPLFLAFLAGFFDADGSLYYHKKGTHGGFELSLTNINESLLQSIARRLQELGFTPRVRIAKQSKDRGVTNGGEFIGKLALWRYSEVSRILNLLPIRHREKAAKRSLALEIGLSPSASTRTRVIEKWNALRSDIKCECHQCIRKAEFAARRKKEARSGPR